MEEDILLRSLSDEIQRVYEQMSGMDPELEEYKSLLECYKTLHNLRQQMINGQNEKEKIVTQRESEKERNEVEKKRIDNQNTQFYLDNNTKVQIEAEKSVNDKARLQFEEKKLDRDTKQHKTEMIFDGCKIGLSFVAITVVPIFMGVLGFGAETSMNLVNGRIISEIGKSYKNLLLFKS